MAQWGPISVGEGGKLVSGCEANQSNLIKVIQPVVPTTIRASLLLFMYVPALRNQQGLDGEGDGLKGEKDGEV